MSDFPDGPAYTYHGETHHLVTGNRAGGGTWYGLRYPKCGRIGSLSQHDVSVDAQGRPTANPSLICGHGCGLHVWLRDGLMTDC